MAAVEHYPPGERAEGLRPGDLLLVEGTSWISGVIRFFDRSRYTHTVNAVDGEGGLADAGWRGVRRSHVGGYDEASYTLVRHGAGAEDVEQMRRFLEAVLAARWTYSFVTFVFAGLSSLTGNRLMLRRDGTSTCSGLSAECLVRAGYIFVRSPAYMTPRMLGEHYGAL